MMHRKGSFLKYAVGILIAVLMAGAAAPAAASEDIVHPFVKSLKTIKMSYQECAKWTLEIAAEHSPWKSLEFEPDDSDRAIVSKAYWRTPKFDAGGCFAQKDLMAAEVEGKSPDEYAVGCIAPEWLHATAQLFRQLDSVRFRPGATCLFRGRLRQLWAEGNKAPACWSLHGGECRTGGCGHGLAADVVNVPLDPTIPQSERWRLTKLMWDRIDEIGRKLGIRRLRGIESMHIQAEGKLATIIAANAKEAIAQVAQLHPDWFGGRKGKKTILASSAKKKKYAEGSHKTRKFAESKKQKNGKHKKVKIARK